MRPTFLLGGARGGSVLGNSMRTAARQFFLAAAIGCTVLGSGGCAAHRRAGDSPALWQASGFHPPMPRATFVSCEAAFKYIAECERLPTDRHTLFALAADSTLERSHFQLTGDLVIVRAQYYGQSRFGIRGAQGQGRYYGFQIRDDGWALVGIFHGSSYRWDAVGDTLRLITRWHMSAAESPETVYTWKGQLFE